MGSADHPPLDSAAITRGLAEAGVPWALLCLDECDSTNREAHARAAADRELAAHGLAVFAGWQSAGRGRRGARWRSAPESDLLFSVALAPELPAAKWGRLTHAAALAVSKALEPRWRPSIKWPNDVYIGGSKVAGILLEGHTGDGLAVVGVGLNVNSDPAGLGDDLSAPATSLCAERAGAAGGREMVDRSSLAVALLRELYAATALAAKDFPAVMAGVEERSYLLGREISLRLPAGEALAGRATGFGAEGELCVETADGQQRRITSGDQVRLLPG